MSSFNYFPSKKIKLVINVHEKKKQDYFKNQNISTFFNKYF